jgi:ATP-binding cassette subfamily B protein
VRRRRAPSAANSRRTLEGLPRRLLRATAARDEEPVVETFRDVLRLGRHRLADFATVAVLVSLGTATTLFEPWIYRAIIDDIAGVFVTPRPLLEAGTWIHTARTAIEHLPGSWARLFTAPLQAIEDAGGRVLAERSLPQAAATVLAGAALLVVLRLFAEGLRLLADNRSARVASDLERDFIVRTFRHVVRLPLSFFTRRSSGAVARQVDQSDSVAPIFTAAAQQLWPDFFRLTAILAILLVSNVELAAVAAIAVVAYGVVTWRSARRLNAELDRYYAMWDEVSSRIQQAIAGIKTVQAHGNEEFEVARLDELSRRAYDAYLARCRVANRCAWQQEAIIALSKGVILTLGGLKALEHQLTPGDVVMFLAYLDRLFTPIENLTGLYTELLQHLASVRRAGRLLSHETALDTGRQALATGPGDVRFESVTFGYSPRRPILNRVSFRLRPGQRTALVGPSGAGKTTVSDLLVGLYRPQAGRITVDDQPLDDVSSSSVRAAVRGVAADGTLFRMSIGENIRYGRLDASDADVREAADRAGLETVLSRLDDGLDTVVGERGVELSVGERQRVLLARAFVARPTILVLDEATANLDFRTEAAVKDALATLAHGRTTLIVAHRPSMLADVDHVVVLREGRVEQQGSPAELLAQEGYFRDLVRADAAPDR